MPSRAVTVLTVLMVAAGAAFAFALHALAKGEDLLAVLSCATGAVALRTLQAAARLTESSSK